MTETAPGEVPPLSLFGRRQLYDEAAFTAGETTTPKAELLKLCAGLRAELDALLGKLAHFLEAPAQAAGHFERALQGLQRTHGREHPLVQDIAARLAEACDEASARV